MIAFESKYLILITLIQMDRNIMMNSTFFCNYIGDTNMVYYCSRHPLYSIRAEYGNTKTIRSLFWNGLVHHALCVLFGSDRIHSQFICSVPWILFSTFIATRMAYRCI